MLLGRKAIGTVAYMGGLPAVLETFTWSWGQMIQYNQEVFCEGSEYIHYERTTISDHAPARNNLVTKFIGDWLIQMDTDHQFEPDIVARMVKLANLHEIDVLSAVYQMKRQPHVPVLFQWIRKAEDDSVGLQPLATWPKEAKLIQIGSAGGGCLFVRRSVFDKISKEYKDEGPFDKIHPYSEDHSFFLRCRQVGVKAYAAMQIHCNHLRVAPVTFDDLDTSELVTSELFPIEGFK